MAPAWRQVLGELGEDLVNREINLIVAPGGMSAEPMPEPMVAMCQVASWYAEYLGLETSVLSEPPEADSLISTFNQIASTSEGKLTAYSPATPGGTTLSDRLLLRIKAHTDALLGVLQSHGTAEFTARELSSIRKAWELGVDPVVLQTVISLDGDVVTRIHARYASADYEPLLRCHEGSVAVAIRTWKELVGAAIDVLSRLFPTANRG